MVQANGAEPGGGGKKLWGGRFTGATDPLMDKFNESLPFDRCMWREDIKVGPTSCGSISICEDRMNVSKQAPIHVCPFHMDLCMTSLFCRH